MAKRINRIVTEQGYSVPKVTSSLGVTDKLLYKWKAKFEAEKSRVSLNANERAELLSIRKEIKGLRGKILKKASVIKLAFKNRQSILGRDKVILYGTFGEFKAGSI